MNDSMDALQSRFRQLRLVETASELPELLRKAEQASWTYREKELAKPNVTLTLLHQEYAVEYRTSGS